MGKAGNEALRLDFDRRLKLEFHGTESRAVEVCLPIENLTTCAIREESLAEVRRKTVKMLDFRRIGAFWGRSGMCLD
jgi:hypothetical protein